MIYPIFPYGEQVLRQKAAPLQLGTDVKDLVDNMFATMDAADGVGLAAPQIGKSLQLFVADVSYFVENGRLERDKYRKVYINPILKITHPETILYYEEGCLSLPGVAVNVPRSKSIRIQFYDRNWQYQEEELLDMPARVIQHEYDHLQGKLHIDYLPEDEKLLINPTLENIKQGRIKVDYKMCYDKN